MAWIFLFSDHDSINFSCWSTSNLKLKWRCSITDKTLINYFLKNHSPDQLFNKEDDIQSKFFSVSLPWDLKKWVQMLGYKPSILMIKF